REFIANLRDPGECSVDIHFAPGSAGDTLIQSVRDAAAVVKGRITFENGVVWTFDMLLMSYEPQVPLDDKMVATVTFKITASYGVTAAAAPANSVLPAVSGVAQEGEDLTALTGVWSGAPAFTYQWQTDGSGSWANISGATASTYTVLTGDVGDNLRVIVTGTNGAGSAAATSAATDAVVAA
ncbi:MAG: phage tail tube protein, partial [Pseudomonadota bacterium]|nr:phage tail tube protein [Pseudomonadota bacterium]